ncbi:gamma-glutamyl-gamma-aminobutyrate hydrolase family protein [Candidatus Woesearchaeota archaeon]|nr:gamma-glutamyl-gamma-aminobutyrate hydrolase family protein [Candidatus Woesearchaeota archaeon]
MILVIKVNKFELHDGEFVRSITQLLKNFKVVHYKDLKKSDLDKSDKAILCGTALKDNEFIKDVNKFFWLKNYDKPVLGICAGMEIIGKVFDCYLEKVTEIGMIKIKTIKKNILFDKKFEAYSLHNYSVNKSKSIDVIAKSDKCISAIKVKNKEIYGVLFHPEVRNNEIINNFNIH